MVQIEGRGISMSKTTDVDDVVQDMSMMMSPWNQSSPYAKSPWSDDHHFSDVDDPHHDQNNNDNGGGGGLLGSLVREEGHVYSLAASNGVLYTGSDSKNIRVWKDMHEFSGFKSNSGLVKAIVVSGDTIFTGHQDGKVRVWKRIDHDHHKRVATMPTFFDLFKASILPKNYVEVKRNRTAVWIRHTDVVSSLSIDRDGGLLYSASWDRTFKVWSLQSSKCLESVRAHDDAVNSVVSAPDGIVYTGSADGTVKVWKREKQGKAFSHVLHRNLHSQESAITAVAVAAEGSMVYCASSEGLVNFWEGEKHGGVLKGHKLAVLCLEAAGKLVLSGSADKTICVWRREGGVHTCLTVLTGHEGPVKCLAVEEEEEEEEKGKWRVYSGSLDKSVKVWSVRDQGGDSACWESFT